MDNGCKSPRDTPLIVYQICFFVGHKAHRRWRKTSTHWDADDADPQPNLCTDVLAYIMLGFHR